MRIDGVAYRTICVAADGWSVEVIDQTRLPHELAITRLTSLAEAAHAIRSMIVRGAPLVGAAAAYGVCLALRADASDAALAAACEALLATRPTAVNLRWALAEMQRAVAKVSARERVAAAYARASAICEEDVAANRAMGEHGLPLIRAAFERRQGPVELLTHCNAGWLATVDYGTALSPVYLAHDQGIPVHVWVDETRPRNQGASLTAWELGRHGVPHTLIADNAGGHLMQHGRVDLCIVGTDRTTARGDVCNKVGTYLKALAAHDNGVPFYVAAPSSSIDWSLMDGIEEIPIEERDEREVLCISGRAADGSRVEVELAPAGTRAANFGFDVTPARLVTGLITERGLCKATREGMLSIFPEHRGRGIGDG